MASHGYRAQGRPVIGKWCVARHTGAPRRGLNACEKAIETAVRQAGRAEAEAGLAEYEADRASEE